ncbi:CD1871A family CXXC motif-containing protein [Paraclostridium bifermentans]|nr:CD1871A family CXXC motif-containing protein [Paraclostridium bifermentans]
MYSVSYEYLFIVVGSSRGEVKVVLKKAVNICLECIGIG